MGSADHYPEEAPPHRVRVDAFAIDSTQVTNQQFAAFVSATGYRTVAERPLRPEDFPTRRREPGPRARWCSRRRPGPVDLRHISQWWTWTPGACWSSPRGPAAR
jgi:formylglycine-generating enzyme required for sulfatase activity